MLYRRFSNIYVTQLNDTATIMNEKLNQGLHLVVSPGIYHLDEPLAINHANQIILGLGLATLVSAKKNTHFYRKCGWCSRVMT